MAPGLGGIGKGGYSVAAEGRAPSLDSHGLGGRVGGLM